MADREIELQVGETVLIGDCQLTVIDVDGAEVTFRIDQLDIDELAITGASSALPPGK